MIAISVMRVVFPKLLAEFVANVGGSTSLGEEMAVRSGVRRKGKRHVARRLFSAG